MMKRLFRLISENMACLSDYARSDYCGPNGRSITSDRSM